jgi:L-amino acid N-acyltransferase YncA
MASKENGRGRLAKKDVHRKVSSTVRAVKYADAARITEIYNHYILNTLITFEEQSLGPEDILARIKSITADYPWLVYEDNGRIVGYAYAARWKERSAYRHTVEAAIYVDVQDTGKHVGSQLTTALLDELRGMKIHSVLAGIALPNGASVALCEKFGFAKVGQLKEVGYKLNQWVDVGYWELILNDLGEAAKM